MDLEHERRLTDVEAKAERCEVRIKKLEESHEALHQLATSVAVMAEKQDTMNRNVEALSEKVDSIESKPAERWDKLISTIIGALAGAFIAWIVSGAPGL
jgi:tetrahydromethanopterin S-methyltransferase subunit G